MNNKSDKMDRQGARTVADLELKFNMGKSFAEAMGISDPSRMTLEDARKVITAINENLESISLRVKQTAEGVEEAKAQIVLAVTTDSEGKPCAVISEKADYIEFKSGQLVIDTDNFKLTSNGTISATNGTFSGVINGAIIGNGEVQLNNNMIEFYKDDEYLGGIQSWRNPYGFFAGVRLGAGGDVLIDGNLFIDTKRSQTTDLQYFKHTYVDGIQAKTGWLIYNAGLEERFMLFINGLLVGVYTEIPSDSPYPGIDLN